MCASEPSRPTATDLPLSPLVTRYGREAMAALFAPRYRARIWRRLWLALAETQRELGLPIEAAQIEALRRHLDDVDLERIAELERRLRHDVMAHLHHLGEQCPEARPILHLGATSCFVTDNADLIIVRDALTLLEERLLDAIAAFGRRAAAERNTACLAYTHLQPAQPTTVGKRIALWLQDLIGCYHAIERLRTHLPFRGAKGATGTQASFLALFDGDHDKVCALDRRLAERMGFTELLPLGGQTYPRVIDHRVLAELAALAAALSKWSIDMRLLQHMGELEEPFGRAQVGSSAMAHKRNPMLCERVGALSRFVIETAGNATHTAATQWLERSLDDSANRRLVLPEALLAADAALGFALVVIEGMQVHARVIAERLRRELPYLALEPILMAAVRAGGDRQQLHEALRRHAMASRERERGEGAAPDLLDRIRADRRFEAVHERLDALLEPARHVGRAPAQVSSYLETHVEPLLRAHGRSLEEEPGAAAAPLPI